MHACFDPFESDWSIILELLKKEPDEAAPTLLERLQVVKPALDYLVMLGGPIAEFFFSSWYQ